MISYHATQTRTLVFFWLLLVGCICAVRGLPTKPCPDGSTQCILRHLVHRGLITSFDPIVGARMRDRHRLQCPDHSGTNLKKMGVKSAVAVRTRLYGHIHDNEVEMLVFLAYGKWTGNIHNTQIILIIKSNI